MKTTFTLLLVLLVSWSWAQGSAQVAPCTLKVTLGGQKYDTLLLSVVVDGFVSKRVTGRCVDDSVWYFSYPDSLYTKHLWVDLWSSTGADTLLKKLMFRTVVAGDTVGLGSFGVKKNDSLRGRFIERKIVRNSPSWGFRPVQLDYFFVSKPYSAEFIQTQDHQFCSFFDPDTTKKTSCEAYLNQYVGWAKQYPDHHYLMQKLFDQVNAFDNRGDVAKVYNAFSPSQKETYFGRKVQQYIATAKFENMVLPELNSGAMEPIIQDATKYNLVVFSASWCAPCHKAIPLYKKAYNDLKKSLVVTYVSTDKKSGIESWRKLSEKEAMPWRSLMAATAAAEVASRYTVLSIPHAILVYPDQSTKVFDIRNEADKALLYQLAR